jgi:hypothetical protein
MRWASPGNEVAGGQPADEQAALRRVATCVAEGRLAGAVFASVTKEVGLLLDAEITRLLRTRPTAAEPWPDRTGILCRSVPGSRSTRPSQRGCDKVGIPLGSQRSRPHACQRGHIARWVHRSS